ncbi:MAG: HAD family phosphatase [Lachnospiraceae bacterium]
MLEDIEAVIFDLDGTLVDSMWIWTDVDEVYLEKYHLTRPDNFQTSMEGMSYSETAQYFVDTFPTLNQTVEQIQKEWHEMTFLRYTTEVTLKQGVSEFIQQLRANGIKCGIATSNSRELVEATVAALGIQHFFDSIRTACEVSAGKPAPDVYLKVAEDLHVPSERCLVFEDIPNGIRAGKNAGMRVCAVDDAFSKSMEQQKRELSDYYIYNYENLYEMLVRKSNE